MPLVRGTKLAHVDWSGYCEVRKPLLCYPIRGEGDGHI